MKSLLLTAIISIVFAFTTFTQWNYVNSGINNYQSLDFVAIHETSGTCLAGGDRLIKSTNNGDSWSTISTSIFHYFNDGLILNSNEYIVVGYDNFYSGIIIKITNGGLNWTPTGSLPSAIKGVSTSGSVLVAVGEDGKIAKSTNNGSSWSQVISGTTADLNTVEWDPIQSIWIAGGNNIRLTSSDGSIWTPQITSYSTTDIKFRNGKLTETKKYANEIYIVSITTNGTTTDIHTGSHIVNTSATTSDNRILCAGYEELSIIQTGMDQFYTLKDSIHGPTTLNDQSVWDIDVGNTYGLAVGNLGSIAKYVFTNPLLTFVPGDFSLSQNFLCPNASFTAVPLFGYADSYNWFLDNIWISNEDTLHSTAPITPGLHTLKLVTSHNGNLNNGYNSLNVFYPPSFPNININVDSTVCFEDEATFHLYRQAGSWNDFFVRLKNDSNIVSYPSFTSFPAQLNYADIQSIPLTTSDTIFVELYTTNTCGTYYHSIPFPIVVSPNLNESFEIVEADSGICFPELNLGFTFTNTYPGANYIFSNTAYINQEPNDQGDFYNYHGTGTDTITVNIADFHFYPVLSNAEHIYSQTEVMNEVKIDMELDGCHQYVNAFNFTVINPNAAFSIDQFPTLTNELIPITNLQPQSDPNWSIAPNINNASNSQSLTPQYTPNQSGNYQIELINNESFGCTDTLTRVHVVAQPLNQATSPTCFAIKQPVIHVLNSMVDHEGNFIEYGYYPDPFITNRSNSVIRKYDPQGNLLWDIHPNMENAAYAMTIMLTTLEIDQDNNLIGSISIDKSNYDIPLEFQLISIQGSFSGNYFVKWNAQGEMILAHRTESLVVYTDIECLNDKLYFICPGYILITDSEFNTTGSIPIPGYHPNTQALVYGSNASSITEWHWTPDFPRMETLQNGTIAIISDIYPFTAPSSFHIGNYSDQPIYENGQFLFAAILHPDSGIVRFRKLFDLENAAFDKTFLKDICVDETNNIYILTQPQFDDYHIYFEDSLIASGANQHKVSFVLKINSNLETKWIAQTSFIDGSIDYSIGNQEVIISGYTEQGIYFGKDQSHHFLPDYNPATFGYFEPGYLLINKNGTPIKGTSFGSSNDALHKKITAAISDCGDIYISHSSGPVDHFDPMYGYTSHTNELILNGITYVTDSNFVFKISDTCSSENCSLLVFNTIDSINLCSYQNTVKIPLYASNNINEIAYTLIQNNNTIETGYFPVINDLVYSSFPSTDSNFVLILTNNNNSFENDTINITFKSSIFPFTNTNYDVQCGDSLHLVLDTLLFHEIFWTYNNQTYSTQVIDLASQNLIPIDTTYLIVNSIGENNCATQQTINIIYCHDLNLLEQEQSGWSLYPNPSQKELTIYFDQYIPFEIEIAELNGKTLIYHRFETNEIKTLDIQSLTAGLYLVRFIGSDGLTATKTFVKE